MIPRVSKMPRALLVPFDIALNIASFLQVPDLCSLGSCSRFWRELCASDSIWISLSRDDGLPSISATKLPARRNRAVNIWNSPSPLSRFLSSLLEKVPWKAIVYILMSNKIQKDDGKQFHVVQWDLQGLIYWLLDSISNGWRVGSDFPREVGMLESSLHEIGEIGLSLRACNQDLLSYTILISSFFSTMKGWRNLYIKGHKVMASRATGVVQLVKQCSQTGSLEVADYLRAIKELCSSKAQDVCQALSISQIAEWQVCVRCWKLGRWFEGFRLRDESRSLGNLAMAKEEEVMGVLLRAAVHEVLRVQISSHIENPSWVSIHS